MPNQDKTGPLGEGPQTGRGLGPCGRGFWRSRCFGLGLGFRRFWSKKNELSTLEEEEKMLKEELQAVQEEKEALKAQK